MALYELCTFAENRFSNSAEEMLNDNALSIFKAQNEHSVEMQIEQELANRYVGDFYGLLQELGRKVNTFYIETVLNGFNSSVDYDGRTTIKLLENDFSKRILKLKPIESSIPKIK